MNGLLLPRGFRNAELLHSKLHRESEEKWIRKGQQRALRLFHEMSTRVPAYRDFLKAHKFAASTVSSIADFSKIPPVNKDNYLRKYPHDMLSWDGEFSHGQWVISTTSGSTGQPYYFPREHSQDWQYAITAELYLRNNFDIQNRSTLYIVAFPMGAWIGGVFTYEALKIVARHGGYDLSIITPGIHKQEVINAVKQLGKSFDQVIIGAYAPFLKDILDDGAKDGISWGEYNLGFVFSAEAFTEKFRDYVFRVADIKDPFRSTLNHYGTVDLGTMAHETPESVMLRRELVTNKILTTIFPEKVRQPTLAQYIPELFFFEEESHNLFCTAYSGIPLVRYDLNDYGGVLTRNEILSRTREAGWDLEQMAKNHRIDDSTWNLPYVYVYERNDFSVSYYAFLIYPDMIRRALQEDVLADKITGKFSMLVDYENSGRQRLNIHIETKAGVESSRSFSQYLENHLHNHLLNESSEYRETYKIVGEQSKPVIHLWKYEDPTHFRVGAKQKWVVN